jgi:hypothetical protein|uniref:Uncharacterized protein n=1 Tax=viral metagenome TaxID=1070528 RepID=A0A6C0ITL8_9ZZZZ
MPKIVKLNEFSNSDTTENKYGKFEKVEIKQKIKLENINKNGFIQLEYDVNNNPYLELNSNENKLVLTSQNITTDSADFQSISIKNNDLEHTIKELNTKINYLETRVTDLENNQKVIEKTIDEDPCNELYLIEFGNPTIGLFGMFKLNDDKKYLYICYNIDKNISYWTLIQSVTTF